MLLRIITSKPAISLATAIVIGLCVFFIISKENQIKESEKKIALFQSKNTLPVLTDLPFPIDYTGKETANLLYRKVELTGSFLPEHEIYLENRVAEDDPKPKSKKISGFHIMMPFLLHTGQIVWVNRGWIIRDPANRQNIPNVNSSAENQKISGYISVSKKDIFEMPRERPHVINGHIVALNFYLHDDKKELPNRNVYPFLITQTGKGTDGLIRAEPGLLFEPDHSFELKTWWFTLLVAIAFWFVHGLIALRRNSNIKRL